MTTLHAKGPYVLDAKLPGRTKAEGFMPSHTTCVQASKNRYLIVFATRGFCGIDDERDVVYQLRADSPDGPILQNKFLAKNLDHWQPANLKHPCMKILGTPIIFGVPKGAHQNNQPLPQQNVFVIKWYTYGKVVEDKKVLIDEDLTASTMHIEWLQCRLNEAEDDIEIISPISAMRQKGYEVGGLGENFCEQPNVKFMNHAMVPPVPFNAAADQWVEVDHFNGSHLAAVRYAFNKDTGLYEWVQMGPLLAGRHTEACICRIESFDQKPEDQPAQEPRWIISARAFTGGGQTAWWRMCDPFAPWQAAVYANPATWGPRTAFRCADDVVRIFSGSIAESPYGEKRNPLFCWDVNTSDFSLSNRQAVFDFYERGFYTQGDERLADSQGPMAGFTKICPHQGRKQLLTHRVTKAGGAADYGSTTNAAELERFGSYMSEFTYDKEPAPAWQFE